MEKTYIVPDVVGKERENQMEHIRQQWASLNTTVSEICEINDTAPSIPAYENH
jgi:hypothetical protein